MFKEAHGQDVLIDRLLIETNRGAFISLFCLSVLMEVEESNVR